MVAADFAILEQLGCIARAPFTTQFALTILLMPFGGCLQYGQLCGGLLAFSGL